MMQNDLGETPVAPEPDGWEWAVVEVFGHRRHAGRTREEERFGAKLRGCDLDKEAAPAARAIVWRKRDALAQCLNQRLYAAARDQIAEGALQ
jgi:hypothetical protein